MLRDTGRSQDPSRHPDDGWDPAPSPQDMLDQATFTGFCLGLAAAAVAAFAVSGLPAELLAALARAITSTGGRS